MKKEEILEMSRKENKKRDAYDLEISQKATNMASIFTLLLVFIFFSLEIFIVGKTNYGLYAIITIFNGVNYLYNGIRNEKNRKLNIFTGIIWLLLTVICTYGYINHLIDISEIITK